MEDLGIKKNGFVDTGIAGPNGRDKTMTLESLKNSFQELVSKAGTNFDTNLAGLADRSGIAANFQQSKGLDNRNEPRARNDDTRKDSGSVASNDHRDAARDDSSRTDNTAVTRPERTDTGARDQANSGDDRHDSQHGTSTDNNTSDTDSAPREADHGENRSASNENSGSNDGESGSAQNQGQNDNQKTAENSNGGEQATTGVNNAAEQIAAQSNGGNIDLAAALLGGQLSKGQSGVGENSNAKSSETIIDAAATGTKQKSIHNTAANQGHAPGQNQQSDKGAQQQGQSAADASAKQATAAQQQGAALAKVIGGADKTQVSVSVSNDAETLTSKPGASLAAGTFLASSNAKGQSQGGNQGNGHQATAGQNTAQVVAASQAQVNQQQAQAQQNANQNAQIQAGAQGTSGGKSGAIGLQAAQGASAGTGAGGDSAAAQTATSGASGNAQQTQQTQQSLQAQANAGAKTSTPGQPVVDQISVKITKALQAGTDRISIQLKPAELGRVDVKMELGNDGRVLAIVTADNKDTLDLLKRDSGELQRALEDAGMQLDSGDLSFNLRGEERELAEQENNAGAGNRNDGEDALEDDIPDVAIIADLENGISDGRIDVKA